MFDTKTEAFKEWRITPRWSAPYDVQLDDYVKAGGGMLATKVSRFVKGAPAQIEDYADWKVDIPLPDSVFDVTKWVRTP